MKLPLGNGNVYVYKYINRFIQWSHVQTLSDTAAFEFGFSLQAKNDILVVGASRTGLNLEHC